MRRLGMLLIVWTLAALPLAAQEDEGRLAERAHQSRDIVYFLQPPETHAFDLYHDYTESRPGVDRYLNVVRKGSAASAPSARSLDTGEVLTVETRTADELLKAGAARGGDGGGRCRRRAPTWW